mmetsp:Transcript_58030/g.106767  ORF Transcript_58030/g.106767 Transcript_58030/m.106767 type:complete len:329 (-) Transcript_58030:119-1105(-)
MPTRQARWDRRHSKGKDASSNYVDNDEASTLQRSQSSSQFTLPGAAKGMPTPLDCGIFTDASARARNEGYRPRDSIPDDDVIEVGPVPEGVGAGQLLVFDHMGASYEVEVPEGYGPGDYFEVALSDGFADENNGYVEKDPYFNPHNLEMDGRQRSDDSTCTGDSDPVSEEDPMWGADWTIERVLPSPRRLPCTPTKHQDLLEEGEWNEDCCVEQQPDFVAFENYVGCRRPSLCGTEPQQPEPVETEVYELNDVSTWFTRLQQRREQALRKGKAKLVRKIDQELEKAREQGCKGSQASFCNREVDEEPAELDGIWGEDWAGLATASCKA